MQKLTDGQARQLRLRSLLLVGNPLTSVAEVAQWCGAMQAQDLASIQWSLGVRLPETTLHDVDAALERREAVRTWPMRGTIHLVPSRDARWMITHLGAGALAGAAKRREYLGITKSDVDRAAAIFAEVLSGGGRFTRAECVQALIDGGLDVAGQVAYHLIWYCSQIGVTCIGPTIGKEQTIVLLDEWAPEQRDLTSDQSWVEIAHRFVRSHGPVTRNDLARWTGSNLGNADRGLAGCGSTIAAVDVGGATMWVDAQVFELFINDGGLGAKSEPESEPGQIWALPGFDELVLGYKDRSLHLKPDQLALVVPGGNGIFRSTIVDDGRILGTWKRTLTAKKAKVILDPFAPWSARQRAGIDSALARYGQFLGREVDVVS